MKYIISLFILSFSLTVIAQDNKAVFPDDFLGIYKGDLNITNPKGTQTIKMEFHLLKTDKINEYTYTIVYAVEGNRQERKYKLIKDPKNSNKFTVDENNGILLDATCFNNNTLYSMFEVSGNLLTTTERFYDGKMDFEITFSSKKGQKKSGGDQHDTPDVISYPVSTLQKAILYKE